MYLSSLFRQLISRFNWIVTAIAIVALSLTGNNLRAQTALPTKATMRTGAAAHAKTAAQSEPQYAKDRVLVKLANTSAMRAATTPGVAPSPLNLGVAFSEIRLLNPSKGNTITRSFSTMSVNDKQNNVYVLKLEESGENAVENALKILKANPAVETAEPVYYYKAFATPNDPMFSQQYALGKINAQQAWNVTTGSKNVVVGIIDTGIDGTHPDLADNLWVNPNPNQDGYINDIHGYDFVNQTGGTPFDTYIHGTHVSGIVGATGNNGTGVTGVNWNVSLAWLNIGLSGDYAGYVSIDAAIEALNYANNHNIKITNNSYGGAGGYSQIFEDAIRNYNGLFVTAAGNDSNDNDINPFYPASSNLPNMIVVAATDENDNLSSFSNYGMKSVQIAAPGSNILSTLPNGQYDLMSGTSMASPFVAGVAALMEAIQPDFSPVQIKETLIAAARQTNSLNGYVASGILDAYHALAMLPNSHLSSEIDLSQSAPPASGSGWTFSNNVYLINGGIHTIKGSNAGSTRRIEVAAGAEVYITLDSATVTGLAANQSPLLLDAGASVKLTLTGNNTLAAGANRAGIEAPQGTTLTINGAGGLTTTGGSNGAGIGGGSNGAGGAVTINGGVITATGGSGAQGIGRGSGNGAAGTFAISGNSVVIANSIGDTDTSKRTGGIVFDGNSSSFYDYSVTVTADATIPADLIINSSYRLTVAQGAVLTIQAGITLTNIGKIFNYGVININGTLMNTGAIVNFGTINGTVTGTPPMTDFPLVNTIDLSDNAPYPQGIGWTFSDNIYTVTDGANVIVTGTSAYQRRIEVATNATASITLSNTSIVIGYSYKYSPLLLHSGANLTLTLEGTNTLAAGYDYAGIQTSDAKLTVTGSGSLTATGGVFGGAGIGGGTNIGSSSGGTIIINGGTVTAVAVTEGAGIGGGTVKGSGRSLLYGGSGGTIIINGGTVTATGGDEGAGIGGGGTRANFDLPYGGEGGNITITGGTVTATGGSEGAGIGGGGGMDGGGAGGTVTITGGVVKATGNVEGQGIGGGGSHGGGFNPEGTLVMNGCAIVFANSVSDINANNKTGGILVAGAITYWYGGNNFSLCRDVTIPDGYSLTIGKDKQLTIPNGITLTNNGTIINYGTITINGKLINNGRIINLGTINGTVTGNPPVKDLPFSNSINLSIDNPLPLGDGWIYANNVYTVLDSANVTVTGTSANQRRIEAAANATAGITLNGATIEGLEIYQSPLWLKSGANITLTLEGSNRLTAGGNFAGIQTTDARLTITGAGSLTATGGFNGAGIGGGYFNDGGSITIRSGTIVGNGNGNAGIGGGNIIISGGNITATATENYYSAAIGGAGESGNILIYGENTKVTAKGGASVDIGAGGQGATQNVFVALPEGNLIGTDDKEIGNPVLFTANPASTGTVTATLPAPFDTISPINLLTGLTPAGKIMSVITSMPAQSFALDGYFNSPIIRTGEKLMGAGASVPFSLQLRRYIISNRGVTTRVK